MSEPGWDDYTINTTPSTDSSFEGFDNASAGAVVTDLNEAALGTTESEWDDFNAGGSSAPAESAADPQADSALEDVVEFMTDVLDIGEDA